MAVARGGSGGLRSRQCEQRPGGVDGRRATEVGGGRRRRRRLDALRCDPEACGAQRRGWASGTDALAPRHERATTARLLAAHQIEPATRGLRAASARMRHDWMARCAQCRTSVGWRCLETLGTASALMPAEQGGAQGTGEQCAKCGEYAVAGCSWRWEEDSRPTRRGKGAK